jgi:hypothetical protein
MNITILLAIACGLIFFTLLAIMVIAVVMTLKWSYVALKEERMKMKGEHKDAGSNVGRDI